MSADRGGFGWFLVGLGIGAAAGVLYAPKAGHETREDLASSAREGSEFVRQRSRQAADKVTDFADRGRDHLNEYVEKARTRWIADARSGTSMSIAGGRRSASRSTRSTPPSTRASAPITTPPARTPIEFQTRWKRASRPIALRKPGRAILAGSTDGRDSSTCVAAFSNHFT